MLVPLQLSLTEETLRQAGQRLVMCDWLTLTHRYEEPVPAWEAGRTVKIDRDGVIEWEQRSWDQVRCPSSDTSIRVRCDGRILQATGNIGRFQEADNRCGIGVLACVDRYAEVLGALGFSLDGFGTRSRVGTIAESGTRVTRVDLAGNFYCSDYAGLCHAMSVRRIGQKLPSAGRFGPTWGYESKRSNWWKAKLYDKDAELARRRRSDGGVTTARFEVQLGQEFLKRHGLDTVMSWKEEAMGEVVYGWFRDQVLKEQAAVEDWSQIPPRLRTYAVLWRDGVDCRTVLSRSQFYKTASKLREFGIDIATACNVVALVRQSREVVVQQVNARRAA